MYMRCAIHEKDKNTKNERESKRERERERERERCNFVYWFDDIERSKMIHMPIEESYFLRYSHKLLCNSYLRVEK